VTRLAVISDAHGNGVALDVALADIRDARVDGVVCLGDLAQGGPQPDQVVDALQRFPGETWFVLGNADAFLLDPEAGAEPVTQEQLEMREWSIDRLGEERLSLLRAFRPTVELDLHGEMDKLLAFHGSPRSFDDILLPTASSDELHSLIGPTDASFLCGGHVHVQWTRRLDSASFFNPGSVGYSRDEPVPQSELRCDPWACYAILTIERGTAEIAFRRVGFDPVDVIDAVKRSGMPDADRHLQLWRA
jgi:predicted phosphodiesterase